MTYKLTRFGNHMVLIDENKVRKPFKSLEELCFHINRYKLKDQISGLEILPEFYLGLIGKSYETIPSVPPQGWLSANIRGNIIGMDRKFEEMILHSGLTNPKLIE